MTCMSNGNRPLIICMAFVAMVLHALVRANNMLFCAADKCLLAKECSTLSYHVETQYVTIDTTTALYIC